MVNRFLNAITEALYAEFGDGYDIHTEDVPQGLDPPCFIVTMITPQRTPQTRVTYRQSVLFAVQYFPEDEENYRNEIHEVISRLDECLEYITVDWEIDSTTVHRQTLTETTDVNITDGVLSYILRVEDVAFRREDGDLMESAEIEVQNG